MYGLRQVIQNGTRVTMSPQSLVDVVFSFNPERIIKPKIIPSHLSDHDMVGVGRKINSSKFKHRIITTRCFARNNHTAHCDEIKNAPWDKVYAETNVNNAWQQMCTILLEIINKHAPLVQKKIRGRNCPWLTHNLRKAMNEGDYLLTKPRKTESALDWSIYKRKCNVVNNLLRKFFQQKQ